VKRTFSRQARSLEQKRTFAVQLVTMRRTLDGYTAEDLARASGLSVPEAAAMLERERMHRGVRQA